MIFTEAESQDSHDSRVGSIVVSKVISLPHYGEPHLCVNVTSPRIEIAEPSRFAFLRWRCGAFPFLFYLADDFILVLSLGCG